MENSKKVEYIPFHTFDHNLAHAEFFVKAKPNEPKYLKNFLYRINRYVQILKEKNPNITKQEVEEIFKNDLKEISEASYCGVNISSLFMNYICYDLFNSKPDRLDALLSFLDASSKTFSDFENLPRSNFTITQIYYAAKLKDEFEKSDFDDIHVFLSQELSKMTPVVKENIFESNLAIIKQLDKFDFLRSYLDINTKKMQSLGFMDYSNALVTDDPISLDELISKLESKVNITPYGNYDISSNKLLYNLAGDSKKVSEKLVSIFEDRSMIDSQTPFNLLTLYSFWINRYHKELDTYLEAMFVIRDFDLVQSMLDGNFKSPSKEDLRSSLLKMNIFYDPARFILEMQKSEKLKITNGSEYDVSDNVYAFSDQVFLSYITHEYSDKYKNYFDSILPASKNDLEKDASHYFNLYNPVFSTYGLKDTTMLYLLICLNENIHSSNAGVILTPNYDGKNSSKFVGIGIDNGMTDTYLLHIKKSTLLEFLDGYMADGLNLQDTPQMSLPLFEGQTDFTHGVYDVPILAPMTEKQKTLIDTVLQDPNYSEGGYEKTSPKKRNFAFIKHLKNVQDYDLRSNPSSQKFLNLKTGKIVSYSSQSSKNNLER